MSPAPVLSRRALLLALVAARPAPARSPVRALILSGRNNHDWRTTTPFLKKILEATGRFEVGVQLEPSRLRAEDLAAVDVLVLDYNGPRWGAEPEAAVTGFVRKGKGLVVVHGASYAFGEMEILADNHQRTGKFEPPWPEYARMTGVRWTNGPPRSGHGKRHIFRVEIVDRGHPVTRGLEPAFEIDDELYHRLIFESDVHVLARAFDAPEIGGTGNFEPVLWTVRFGKGRVFHTTLGHDTKAMQAPGFRITFARGAEWAATGKVTLAAEPPEVTP
jgi:type 1 glutamine amidotransferase